MSIYPSTHIFFRASTFGLLTRRAGNFCFLHLLLLLSLSAARAAPENNPVSIHIASAANFRLTLEQLAHNFSKQHDNISLNISSASTGALYEQIVHGAPYDIYFAADKIRPRLLTEKNLADKTTLFDYAQGQLVMLIKTDFAKTFNFNCSKKDPLIPSAQLASFLAHTDKIIVANPRTAPYGESAIDFLASVAGKGNTKTHWKYVKAKNVLHAQQLFRHTRAPVAIISASQLYAQHPKIQPTKGLVCAISSHAHKPIVQSAVIIQRHTDHPLTPLKQAAITRFWKFMHSKQASDLIQQHGYKINNNEQL
jgi:molybdate transport system substrate-binding protein